MTEAQLSAVAATLGSADKHIGQGMRCLFKMQASVHRAQLAIDSSARLIKDAQSAALREKLRQSVKSARLAAINCQSFPSEMRLTQAAAAPSRGLLMAPFDAAILDA
jgi:hypothetical protein